VIGKITYKPDGGTDVRKRFSNRLRRDVAIIIIKTDVAISKQWRLISHRSLTIYLYT